MMRSRWWEAWADSLSFFLGIHILLSFFIPLYPLAPGYYRPIKPKKVHYHGLSFIIVHKGLSIIMLLLLLYLPVNVLLFCCMHSCRNSLYFTIVIIFVIVVVFQVPMLGCCYNHSVNQNESAQHSRPRNCCGWSTPSRRIITSWGKNEKSWRLTSVWRKHRFVGFLKSLEKVLLCLEMLEIMYFEELKKKTIKNYSKSNNYK